MVKKETIKHTSDCGQTQIWMYFIAADERKWGQQGQLSLSEIRYSSLEKLACPPPKKEIIVFVLVKVFFITHLLI